jgi:hypothetical protein
VGEQVFAGERCRDERGDWGDQEDTPAPVREPHQQSEPEQYSDESHRRLAPSQSDRPNADPRLV